MDAKFWVIVTLGSIAGLLWYAGHCLFRPWAACLKCKGVGKFTSKSGKTNRKCRRCHATGDRLRVGRRVYNYLRKLQKDAS